MAAHPYPDHLFGDLDQPAKGALHHISQTRGLHHAYRISPWLPEPGQPFIIRTISSSDMPAKRVLLRYSIDHGKSWREEPFLAGERHWDTLSWSWLTEWRLDLGALTEDRN